MRKIKSMKEISQRSLNLGFFSAHCELTEILLRHAFIRVTPNMMLS